MRGGRVRRQPGVGSRRRESKSTLGAAVGLRLGAGFVDKAGEAGADGEVFDVAEGVEAEASGAVDDHQAGGAAQAVETHRDGGGCARGVCVDTDRERYLIFVKEGFE